MALDGNERKALYRNLINDPATQTETKKYSFTDWERKLLGDEKAIGKLAQFSIGRNWAIDENDFVERYVPEFKSAPAPPTKKATTIPPVGIAAPVAEPAPSITDIGREMAFEPAVQQPIEPVEPVGVMAPEPAQKPIPSVTEVAREMAFKPPVPPQMPEEGERGFGEWAGDVAGTIAAGGKRIGEGILSSLEYYVNGTLRAGLPEIEATESVQDIARNEMFKNAAQSQKQFQDEAAKRNIQTSVLQAIDKEQYKDIPEAVLYTVGDAAMQIIPSILTMGGSTYLQTLPQAYKDGVEAIAKEKGISPEQVIANGDDAMIIATISSGVQSALEFLGAGLVSKSMASRGAYKAMRDWLLRQGVNRNLARGLGLLGVGVGEGLTEYSQEGTGQIGVIAAKSPTTKAFFEKLPKELFTPQAKRQREEAFVGGLIGGAGVGGGGQVFQSAMDRTLFEAPKIGKATQRPDANVVMTDDKLIQRNNLNKAMESAIQANPEAEGQIRERYRKLNDALELTDDEVVSAYDGIAQLPDSKEKDAIRERLEQYMAEKGIPAEPTGMEAGLGEGLRATPPTVIQTVNPDFPAPQLPITEEATVAPLTEEELAQIEETELTPEEEAALLAQEETAPAPAEEAPTPEQRAEYGLEPLRPTYRGASMAEWQEIQGGKKFGSKEGFGENQGNVTWITDNKEYSQQQVEKNDDGVLIEFKPEAIDKSSVESGQRGDDTGVRLGRDLDINDVLRVTDKNGNVIYESTSVAPATEEVVAAAPVEEVAPEAPAAPAPKGRKKKEAPVTPAPAAPETKTEVEYTQEEDDKLKAIQTEANLNYGNYIKNIPSGRKDKFANDIYKYEATNPFTGEKVVFKKKSDAADYVIKEISAGTTKKGREGIFRRIQELNRPEPAPVAEKEEGKKPAPKEGKPKPTSKPQEAAVEIAKAFTDRFGIKVNLIDSKGLQDLLSGSENAKEFFFKVLDKIDVFETDNIQEAKNFITTVFQTVESAEDAKKAYRKLAIKYHPDKRGSEEVMKHLNDVNEKYQKGTLGRGTAQQERPSQATKEQRYREWAERMSRQYEADARAYAESSQMGDEQRAREAAKAQAEKEAREARAKAAQPTQKETKAEQPKPAQPTSKIKKGIIESLVEFFTKPFGAEKTTKGEVLTFESRSKYKQDAWNKRNNLKEENRKNELNRINENLKNYTSDRITTKQYRDNEAAIRSEYANKNKAVDDWYNNTVAAIDKAYEKKIPFAYKQYVGDKVAGLYDPVSLQAYVVLDNLDETTFVHEAFSHPFIEAVKERNNELYNNLLAESKNTQEIVDYVDENYGNAPQQVKDAEYIARAIDLDAKGKLKNKTLIEYVRQFWAEANKIFKDIFGGKGVAIENISPTTKVSDIVDFVLTSGEKLDLTKPSTPSFTSQQSSEAATAFDKAKTSKGFDKKYGKGAYKALSDITKNFDAIMDKVSDKIKQDCL